ELQYRALLELLVRLLEMVAQPAECFLSQRGGERAHTALDAHATRTDVPRAVAHHVADGRVAAGALVLEPIDDRVQPLDQKGLRREHVAGAAHHAAVAAGSLDAYLECI